MNNIKCYAQLVDGGNRERKSYSKTTLVTSNAIDTFGKKKQKIILNKMLGVVVVI